MIASLRNAAAAAIDFVTRNSPWFTFPIVVLAWVYLAYLMFWDVL